MKRMVGESNSINDLGGWTRMETAKYSVFFHLQRCIKWNTLGGLEQAGLNPVWSIVQLSYIPLPGQTITPLPHI